MRQEIKDAICTAAKMYGAKPESVTSYLKDAKKMTVLKSPCTCCNSANPPHCRHSCGSLSVFRTVMQLQDTLRPQTSIETEFGNISVNIRQSSTFANWGLLNASVAVTANEEGKC